MPFLLIGALLLAAGCDRNEPAPTQPDPPAPMPTASSPESLMAAFAWCNQNLSIDEYRTLFTDDFQFVFPAMDTMGNQYRDHPWTREDELTHFQNLVNGGAADQPAARLITLVLDRSFRVEDDLRPGKYDPDRRKIITTHVNLMIQTIDGAASNVNGKATFFLVRGDSALIPDDLGHGPDPNRWYIERWEDQTYAPTGLTTGSSGAAPRPQHAQPASKTTWGTIKVRYR